MLCIRIPLIIKNSCFECVLGGKPVFTCTVCTLEFAQLQCAPRSIREPRLNFSSTPQPRRLLCARHLAKLRDGLIGVRGERAVMGLALVSVDFEARKNAYLFRESLGDNSEEELRGFFFDGWSYVFITDQRLGKWDPIFGKEKNFVALQEVDTITRHDKLTGPKVVATKKDGSEEELAGSWIADPDDIGLLQQIHAGSGPFDEDARRDYLFDTTSEQIPVPPSLQSPQSKAAMKQAAAWEKKRATWEKKYFAERKVQREWAESEEQRQRAKEEKKEQHQKATEEKYESLIKTSEKHLLRGETCRAVLPAQGSNIFVSDMRIGLIDSGGLVHDDYPLQSVTNFRFETKTLSTVLYVSVAEGAERKLGSVSLKSDVEAFKSEVDEARQSPAGLYIELADQYAKALGEPVAGKSKKDSKNRNLMLGAMSLARESDTNGVHEVFYRLLKNKVPYDSFKRLVEQLAEADLLRKEDVPNELYKGLGKNFLLFFDGGFSLEGRFRKYSPDVSFAVVEDGQDTRQHVYEGQYFTGGTAFLLGRGGSSQKAGSDDREAELVITGPSWQESIPIDPDEAGSARKLIARIEPKVRNSQASQPTVSPEATNNVSATPSNGVADEIKKLGDLRKEGVLSEEEFQAAKKNALGL